MRTPSAPLCANAAGASAFSTINAASDIHPRRRPHRRNAARARPTPTEPEQSRLRQCVPHSTRETRWRASPKLVRFGGFLRFFGDFQEIRERQTTSAPIRRALRVHRRDSEAPPSASTSRTRSACRDTPSLANMCCTCERIVFSPRPVTAATLQTVLPLANITATRLSILVSPNAAATTAGPMRTWPAGLTITARADAAPQRSARFRTRSVPLQGAVQR